MLTDDSGVVWRVPEQHYSEDEDEALFFYGGPLSNFVGGPVRVASRQPWFGRAVNHQYRTVEHFFQASKAISRETHLEIASKINPWDAKHAGRSCILREDWEDVKYEIMLAGLRIKFEQPWYMDVLHGTGNRYIAEDSPTDAVWGIRNPHTGALTGDNLLGKALMQIRDEIKALMQFRGEIR